MRALTEVLRNLWKAYLAIALLTSIFTIVYLGWMDTDAWCNPQHCNLFKNYEHFASFYVTWIEDVVFFSLIGIPALWVSLRKPDDDHVEYRFRYLFNSDDAQSANIVSEFDDIFTKIAAFSPYTKIDLVIDEYLTEQNAFRIRAHYTMHISNMYKDHEYVDPKSGLLVEIDESLEGLKNIGAATKHRIIQNNIVKDHIKRPIYFSREKKEFVSHHELRIPPNGSVFCELEYYLYIKNPESFWAQVGRYTKDATVTLRNDLDNCRVWLKSSETSVLGIDEPFLPAEEERPIYKGKMHSYKPLVFEIRVEEIKLSKGEIHDNEKCQ